MLTYDDSVYEYVREGYDYSIFRFIDSDEKIIYAHLYDYTQTVEFVEKGLLTSSNVIDRCPTIIPLVVTYNGTTLSHCTSDIYDAYNRNRIVYLKYGEMQYQLICVSIEPSFQAVFCCLYGESLHTLTIDGDTSDNVSIGVIVLGNSDNLETESDNIVGAINELNEKLNSLLEAQTS